MIKLSFCLRRLPGTSLEQFQDYWRNQHGPLVREHADALRIRRYCQVHRMDNAESAGLSASRGGPEPFDGIAELWVDSLDAIQSDWSTDKAREYIRIFYADEQNFIDWDRSTILVSNERVVMP